MNVVDPFPLPDSSVVSFAQNVKHRIPAFDALMWDDGKVLVELELNDDERDRLARGEHVKVWTWVNPKIGMQPFVIEIADEVKG